MLINPSEQYLLNRKTECSNVRRTPNFGETVCIVWELYSPGKIPVGQKNITGRKLEICLLCFPVVRVMHCSMLTDSWEAWQHHSEGYSLSGHRLTKPLSLSMMDGWMDGWCNVCCAILNPLASITIEWFMVTVNKSIYQIQCNKNRRLVWRVYKKLVVVTTVGLVLSKEGRRAENT